LVVGRNASIQSVVVVGVVVDDAIAGPPDVAVPTAARGGVGAAGRNARAAPCEATVRRARDEDAALVVLAHAVRVVVVGDAVAVAEVHHPGRRCTVLVRIAYHLREENDVVLRGRRYGRTS